MDGEEYGDEFKITAIVSACPLGPSDSGDKCGFKDGCKKDRYVNQTWYPEPNGVIARRRRRRDTTEAQTQTTERTLDIYHPCKFVSEDIPMCFSDDNDEQGKEAFMS